MISSLKRFLLICRRGKWFLWMIMWYPNRNGILYDVMWFSAGQADHTAGINKPSLQHYTTSVQGYRPPSLIHWMSASSTQHCCWKQCKGRRWVQSHIWYTYSTWSNDRPSQQITYKVPEQGRDVRGALEFPVSLHLLPLLVGPWNINSGCLPSE